MLVAQESQNPVNDVLVFNTSVRRLDNDFDSSAAGIEESDNIDGMRNAFIDAFMKQLSEQKLVR